MMRPRSQTKTRTSPSLYAWLAIALAIAFSGCGTTSPTIAGSSDVSAAAANLPPPINASLLRPGDQIGVDIQSVPDPYTAPLQINEDGLITLRYVGDIQAAGLTARELAQRIEETYIEKEIYKRLDVSVAVTDRFIYIGGQVNRPGRVLWTPDLTVTKAILSAGGYGVFADQADIKLTRDKKIYRIDGRKAQRDPNLDPQLAPGDSLEVGRGLL